MGRFGVTHTGEGCNRMRGANILFNLVTFVFVALTLVVIVYAVAIAGDMAEPPFLLPPTDPVMAGEAMGVTRRFVEFHLDRRLASLAILGD